MRLSSYVLAKAIFLTRIASFFDLLCDLFRVVGATKTQFSGQNILEVAITLFRCIPESFRPKERLRKKKSLIFHFLLNWSERCFVIEHAPESRAPKT
jgi:hypothetical protein